MPQRPFEPNGPKNKLVAVTHPEVPESEGEVAVAGAEEDDRDETRTEPDADGDTALSEDENLLAASQVQVVRKGGWLWVLVVVLLLLLVASGGLNWLQHEALSASEAGSTQMASSLGAAQQRATAAEAEAAMLHGLVSDVGQGLTSLQVQLSDLAIRVQEATGGERAPEDHTSRSITSAE